jgi:hypothetical protein
MVDHSIRSYDRYPALCEYRNSQLCVLVGSRKDHQRRRPVIWFIWFVSFVWLNETDQINKTNQINQMNQTDRVRAGWSYAAFANKMRVTWKWAIAQ